MQIQDEARAWALVRAGDEAGLRWLFDQYYNRLLQDAARLLADADACQDMVQDVFADIWRRREELDIHTHVGAYLRRMVVNKTLNYIKAQSRFAFGNDELWADTPDAPFIAPEPGAVTLEEAVRVAVDSLPEKCRLVFTLSRFENMSHKEIAESLGISTKTVENQMTKALRNLRAALQNRPDLSCVIILAINSAWIG
ncbi:MAG: RNA polymerase sigma-70 factor [Saprospiraceae bacterium]